MLADFGTFCLLGLGYKKTTELQLHFEIPAVVLQGNPGITQRPNDKRHEKITIIKIIIIKICK